MMTEYSELKMIAEACHKHQPLRFMRSHGALYIRNDSGIVFTVYQDRSFPDFMSENKDYADLVLAAKPALIIGLIADLERNQRMLLAACMDLGAIGGALNADTNSDGEEILSMVVDMQSQLDEAQADLAREKTISRGWYENWGWAINDRDQLKSENRAMKATNYDLLSALKAITNSGPDAIPIKEAFEMAHGAIERANGGKV
jgi:hypothetical protein